MNKIWWLMNWNLTTDKHEVGWIRRWPLGRDANGEFIVISSCWAGCHVLHTKVQSKSLMSLHHGSTNQYHSSTTKRQEVQHTVNGPTISASLGCSRVLVTVKDEWTACPPWWRSQVAAAATLKRWTLVKRHVFLLFLPSFLIAFLSPHLWTFVFYQTVFR
jgi:hypothetical protein